MKVSASVFMTIQVEVYVGDWEASQPFEGLHKHAAREAEEKLSRVIQANNKDRDLCIVRNTAVMHVITKERKD